jgi:hypothetical protein
MSEPNWYNVIVRVDRGKLVACGVERRNDKFAPIPMEELEAVVTWANTEIITNDMLQEDGNVHLVVEGAQPEQPKRKRGRPRKR